MSWAPEPKSRQSEDALAVVQRLREGGHTAYFAGGCVRDLLLGLSPKDYDVATDASPTRVRELFDNTQAVGAAFGVILVKHRGTIIEVATFRTDLEYRDGRRPVGVQFSSPEEDAKRRDFTINGLFLDPINHRVIDFVNGQADLAAKQLRAIGNPNDRFSEDHLRLLRAVRFASRFSFEIESATASAIAANAIHLPRISPERVGEELRKMLTAPTRSIAWGMLWKLNLIPSLFRFLPTDGEGRLQDNRSLFTEMNEPGPISFGHSLAVAMLDYRWQKSDRKADPRLFMTTPETNRSARALRQGLKISNEETDDFLGTLSGAAVMLTDEYPSIARMKRMLAMPTQQHSRSTLLSLKGAGLFVDRIGQITEQLDQLAETDYAPPPWITGDDLTAAGAKPGPAFKLALEQAYDAQLENRIHTKQAAMQIAMDLIGQK